MNLLCVLERLHFNDRPPINIFLKLGYTPWKNEQPLQGMELQGKKAQKH